MQAWSAWLPDVLPHVAGCPRLVVLHEVRRAAEEFLRRSRAWQIESDLIPVPAGATSITLTFPDATAELVRIERAYLDGRPLTPFTPTQLNDQVGTAWVDETGVVDGIVQLTPWAVRPYRIPTDAAVTGLKVMASVCTKEGAGGMPDDIARMYRDAVTFGARGRLMLIPGKPWSDAKLAAGYLLQAESIAEQAAGAAQVRGHGRGMRRTTPSWC